MSRMNSFFDELVEAKLAIEALPKVQSELQTALAQGNHLQEANDRLNEVVNSHLNTIEALNFRIGKLEADLAQATFREKEVRGQVEVVLSTLRGLAKEASETAALVDPPVPTAVDPITSSASPATSLGSETIKEVEVTTQGQSEAGPTSSISMTHETVSSGENSMEATRSPAGPFASSMEEQSQDAPATTNTSVATESQQESTAVVKDASPPKPYEGQPYWYKPRDMSYQEWHVDGGGELPYWVTVHSDGLIY